MKSPEELFNLVNYKEHPENSDFMVFFHYNFKQGYFFEHLLKQNHIDHELFIEDKVEKPVMLFGIRKRYFKKAEELNNLSYARFKKPFIPFKWLRVIILVITASAILFAIAGYFLSTYK